MFVFCAVLVSLLCQVDGGESIASFKVIYPLGVWLETSVTESEPKPFSAPQKIQGGRSI